MSKKLRKPLSWLLALCMILSLLPMSVFAEPPSEEETYITANFYTGAGLKVDLTILVKNEAGDLLQTIDYGEVYRSGSTETITLNQAYAGIYELASITSENGDVSEWSGQFNSGFESTFTYSAIGEETDTITVTLKEAENTLRLTDGNVDLGSIAYKEGLQTTNVEVYLNYNLVTTFENVGIGNVQNNFVLNLNSGYYYGDAANNMDYSSEIPGQTITYDVPTNRLTYGVPSTSVSYQGKENTIKLYFFNYEGIDVDFERTVNGITIENKSACPSMEISYRVGDQDYTFTYEQWDDAHAVYLPKNTKIYVSPNIQDGYGFNYWYCSDSLTNGNAMYTINEKGELIEEHLTSVVTGTYALSKDMAFELDAPGYDRGRFYLRMQSDGGAGGGFYTVTYDANGGSGVMEAQTFYDYYVYISENGFTPPSGKTFVSWNTEGLRRW